MNPVAAADIRIAARRMNRWTDKDGTFVKYGPHPMEMMRCADEIRQACDWEDNEGVLSALFAGLAVGIVAAQVVNESQP